MTVRLLTGAPGAGKTTYGVAELLASLVGSKITLDDGQQVERRLLVAGVRGLKLPHERLPHKLTGETTNSSDVEFWNCMRPDFEDAPLWPRLAGDPPVTEVTLKDGGRRPVVPMVQNWWLWCQPGDFIFIDEAQFLAPRGTLGKKPPYWIQLLEIHRHYAVDFCFVTQHPQLIDTVIRALVGHHDHVRSIMATSLCSVYTWDHCGNPERFNLANKRLWKRRAKHYTYFHSAVAHVKPPSTGRAVAFVLPILALGVAGGAYSFTDRWRDKAPSTALSGAPGATPAAGSTPAPPVVVVGGCWTVADVCKCITREGRPYAATPKLCHLSASGFDGLVKWNPRDPPLQPPQAYGARAGGSEAVTSHLPPPAPVIAPPSVIHAAASGAFF